MKIFEMIDRNHRTLSKSSVREWILCIQEASYKADGQEIQRKMDTGTLLLITLPGDTIACLRKDRKLARSYC